MVYSDVKRSPEGTVVSTYRQELGPDEHSRLKAVYEAMRDHEKAAQAARLDLGKLAESVGKPQAVARELGVTRAAVEYWINGAWREERRQAQDDNSSESPGLPMEQE